MEKRNRQHQIKVYLNDTELETLKTLLNGYKGSRSEFIRISILNANTTQFNAFNDGVSGLIKEYKAIGNNFNQLTRTVNQGKCKVDKEELQTIGKELTNLWLLLKSLKVGEL